MTTKTATTIASTNLLQTETKHIGKLQFFCLHIRIEFSIYIFLFFSLSFVVLFCRWGCFFFSLSKWMGIGNRTGAEHVDWRFFFVSSSSSSSTERRPNKRFACTLWMCMISVHERKSWTHARTLIYRFLNNITQIEIAYNFHFEIWIERSRFSSFCYLWNIVDYGEKSDFQIESNRVAIINVCYYFSIFHVNFYWILVFFFLIRKPTHSTLTEHSTNYTRSLQRLILNYGINFFFNSF